MGVCVCLGFNPQYRKNKLLVCLNSTFSSNTTKMKLKMSPLSRSYGVGGLNDLPKVAQLGSHLNPF